MKMVFDGGHHPTTAGKRAPDDSLREAHFNHAVVEYIVKEMEKYKGVEILVTHSAKTDVPLQDRVLKANKFDADVFISVHANAFGSGGFNDANGIETFTSASKPQQATLLANHVQKALIEATKLTNRGVKHTDFYVLKYTKMTAILIECGFMTNKEELALLKSDAYRKKVAQTIVKAIVEVYKLEKKPVAVRIVEKVKEGLTGKYRVISGSFGVRRNAERRVAELKDKGFDSFLEYDKQKKMYRIATGSFTLKLNAEKRVKVLAQQGFDSFVQYVKK